MRYENVAVEVLSLELEMARFRDRMRDRLVLGLVIFFLGLEIGSNIVTCDLRRYFKMQLGFRLNLMNG